MVWKRQNERVLAEAEAAGGGAGPAGATLTIPEGASVQGNPSYDPVFIKRLCRRRREGIKSRYRSAYRHKWFWTRRS